MNKDYTAYQLRTQIFTGKMSAVLTLVNGLVSVLAVSCLSYFVLMGQVKAGALLAVLSLIPNFGSSVMQYLSEGEFYKSGLALFQEKFPFAADSYQLEGETAFPSLAGKTRRAPKIIRLENIKLPFHPPIHFPSIQLEASKKYVIIEK